MNGFSNEQAAAHALLRMLAVGRRYPDGKMPRLGVTTCRDWLLEHYDENSFEFCLLCLAEIHADDAGWSLDGVPQGEPWTLIECILGKMSDRDAADVEHALENYDCEIGALVLEACERRNGEKSPHEHHQQTKMDLQNSADLADRACDSTADQNLKNLPGSLSESRRCSQVSPDLWRRLILLSEEDHARGVLKSCVLARIYPSGVVPPWGVTMCREWLRASRDENSLEFRLLNLVEVHHDDQGWSLDSVPQGGVWSLVKWIVGDMDAETAGWVLTDMHVDYDALVSEAKFAAERQRQNASYTASASAP